MAFSHGGAKGRQVSFFQVARRWVDVESVAQGFGTAVYCEVLACGHGAQVVQIAALHAGNKCHTHLAGKKRVFAVCLLAAAPTGIAEDVYVGRPERQSKEDTVVAFSLRLIVFGAAFGGDDLAHVVNDGRVPRGGHADGLGKDGGITRASHAVQGLIPGLVIGNAETRYCCGPVFKLGGFFVQRHAAHQQVGALCGREFRV